MKKLFCTTALTILSLGIFSIPSYATRYNPQESEHLINQLTYNRKKKNFTAEEDDRLKELVEEFGDKWGLIAERMPWRSAQVCRDRYTNFLAPYLKQGIWSEEEDKLLIKMVTEVGCAWKKISTLIPGRSKNQLKIRWLTLEKNVPENLRPKKKLTRKRFTPEEDNRLVESVEQFGQNWDLIAERMSGRTAKVCRNRFKEYLASNMVTPWSKEEDEILMRMEPQIRFNGNENFGFLPQRTQNEIIRRLIYLRKKPQCNQELAPDSTSHININPQSHPIPDINSEIEDFNFILDTDPIPDINSEIEDFNFILDTDPTSDINSEIEDFNFTLDIDPTP